MKNLLKYVFPIAFLGVVACKRDHFCECVDEHLVNIKAFRLKNYEGNMKGSSLKCKELKLYKKSFDEFQELQSNAKCANFDEMNKENKLWLDYLLTPKRGQK